MESIDACRCHGLDMFFLITGFPMGNITVLGLTPQTWAEGKKLPLDHVIPAFLVMVTDRIIQLIAPSFLN